MRLAQGHWASKRQSWELMSSCLASGLTLRNPHAALRSLCFHLLVFPGETRPGAGGGALSKVTQWAWGQCQAEPWYGDFSLREGSKKAGTWDTLAAIIAFLSSRGAAWCPPEDPALAH